MKNYKSLIKERVLQVKESDSSFQKAKITSSKNAYDYIKQFYKDDISIYESFFILLLNRSNNTIGYAKISQGGIVGTVVDIKIIAKYAIDTLSSGVILAHNHPSGRKQPSDADKDITDKIKQGLKLFEVNVIDHLILTEEDYYSFADNGIL